MSLTPSKIPIMAKNTHFIGHGRILLLNKLAKGAFGDVYVALGPGDPDDLKVPHHVDHYPLQKLTRLYAVKRTKKDWSYSAEVAAHKLVSDHPNIVTLHHVIEEGSRAYLVMDYLPLGDLRSSLIKNPALYQTNQMHSKRLFLQLLEAVDYCHGHQVFHRDLKPENILLADLGGRAVLADFGLSTRHSQSVDFGTGSSAYMSPECLGLLYCVQPYSPMASDIWSLGVILFRIIFGFAPWSHASTSSQTFLEFLVDPDFFLRKYPVSIEFHRALVGIFNVDPGQRVSIKELIDVIRRIEVFSLRDDPATSSEVKSKYVERLNKGRVKRRIRGLGNVLDSERLLKKLGLVSSSSSAASSSLSSSSMDLASRNPLVEVHEKSRLVSSDPWSASSSRHSGSVSYPGPSQLSSTSEMDWINLSQDPSSSSMSTSSASSDESFILATPEDPTAELPEVVDHENIVDETTLEEDLLEGNALGFIHAGDASFLHQHASKKHRGRTARCAGDIHEASTPDQINHNALLLDFMGGRFGMSGGAFTAPTLQPPFVPSNLVFGSRLEVRSSPEGQPRTPRVQVEWV